MEIITNNPKVLSANPWAKMVCGGPLEVLGECRRKVHQGYGLFVHPLMGDIHLLVNPFRTVILGEKKEEVDLPSLKWVEETIERLLLRCPEMQVLGESEDYQVLDSELFQTAMKPKL
jgi:hypothetical protein